MKHLVIYGPAIRTGGPLSYVQNAIPLIVERWPGTITFASTALAVGMLKADAADERIHFLTIPGGGGFDTVRKGVAQARSIGREGPIDVAFCLGNTSYFGPRVPSVTLLQNAAKLRDLRWPSPAVMLYFMWLSFNVKLAALRSTELIAVSEFVGRRGQLLGYAPPRKVIYHGISEGGGGRPEQSLSPKGPARRWLIPGAVHSYKGIEHAIYALSLCREASLEVVGPVSDHRYFERLRGLALSVGVADRVEWVGPVTHGHMRERLAAADVLLITSRAEACPNVLLEGAATAPQRPIVSLDFEWSVEYGDLIDARVAVSELGATLAAMSGNSSENQVSRRLAFLDRLTWENCADYTVEVLLRVAQHRSA